MVRNANYEEGVCREMVMRIATSAGHTVRTWDCIAAEFVGRRIGVEGGGSCFHTTAEAGGRNGVAGATDS